MHALHVARCTLHELSRYLGAAVRGYVVALLLSVLPPPAVAQLEPPRTGGVVALDRILHQLTEPRRLLLIAAHPDDEDTSLLALLAQGRGADVAYLSLSRGEGGQNLIGTELGIGLGLIRSRELMAARAQDGARQYFTRAFDFGFTRSLAETEQRWLPDSVLKDIVRVIRRFRPHVVVSTFSGTLRDGHGQHQMSGALSPRAFYAAGDPSRFPELAPEEGLAPWTSVKFYRSTRWDTTGTTVVLPAGGIDPRTGRTYFQIAMGSRSLHRSQDFGVLQPIGPNDTRLALVEPQGERFQPEAEVFDGVPGDSTWVSAFADSLRRTIVPANPGAAVPALARALARARTDLARSRVPAIERAVPLLEEALSIAAGVMVDARAGEATLIAGQRVSVDVDVYNAGDRSVRLTGVAVRSTVRGLGPVTASPEETVLPGRRVTRRLELEVPVDAQLTQPYFLEHPLADALYDWSDTRPELRGEPFDPPVLSADIALVIHDVPVRLTREVTYRWNDQAYGERREPVNVVPLIEVEIDPDNMVWSSTGPETRDFTVQLTYNGSAPVRGSVTVEVPGWPAAESHPFELERRGEIRTLRVTVRRPRGVEQADVSARAVARTETGEEFDRGIQLIAYPHIRPTPWVRPAVSDVHVAPIALPAVRRVGYVRGAADRVPEALLQVGLPLDLLDAETLARGDLSVFDAIVIGARAYETDSTLMRVNPRLLDYVRNGGLMLVQYQQYQFINRGYPPYPLTIARPHDRVTDETSPVTVLDPRDRVFTDPNRIAPSDWDGWPQERGLYFARTWDDAYRPLLELQDPGLPSMRGGLLVARYGNGTWIYTGLSFFRALPAGTTGAFRLFLNLLNLAGGDGS